LAPLRERNAALAALFYDLESLTTAERARLMAPWDRKGSIPVVSPGAAAQPIRHYKNALRFMNDEGDRIEGIALVGVGSSGLGTAASSATARAAC
jgi:hypothetical protein